MKNQAPINFLFALFLCFAMLKIAGLITWHWAWVTSPLWLPFAIVASCAGLFAALILFAYFFVGKRDDKR